MSKAKKLDLSYEELCEIAKALNENILANRLKYMDERITTDHFIRQKFNISRKDFGFTAKEFGIKYNPTNFFYEIPNYNYNTTVVNKTEPIITTVIKQNVSEEMAATLEECTTNYNCNNTSLDELMPTIIEMIDWYREQKNKPLIQNEDSSCKEINLNNEKLSGAIGIHTMKCYESIFNEFLEVCNQNKSYRKYDLVSLALLEFVEKYKKQ